ncbi:MAG: hypothetical protein ACXWJN_04895, partial [Methyloceanibacter sp.]
GALADEIVETARGHDVHYGVSRQPTRGSFGRGKQVFGAGEDVACCLLCRAADELVQGRGKHADLGRK